MEAGRNRLPDGLGPGKPGDSRSEQNGILSKCLQSVLTSTPLLAIGEINKQINPKMNFTFFLASTVH